MRTYFRYKNGLKNKANTTNLNKRTYLDPFYSLFRERIVEIAGEKWCKPLSKNFALLADVFAINKSLTCSTLRNDLYTKFIFTD